MLPAAHPHHMERPVWQASFAGAAHCGSDCALGDFIGDWVAFGIGFTVLGLATTYPVNWWLIRIGVKEKM